MSTLNLINLTKQFGAVTAVDHVNLSVGDGEFVCILGPSGCGKSTTLRMIGGFEEATSGDVQIDGVSVVDLPPNRRPTAMVFQRYTLWPHMRVYDNIAFGLRLRHTPGPQIDQEVHSSLELVGLAGYESRYPAQLSGGEQQRVAIARAVAKRPEILLCDEPTGALDFQTGKLVLEAIATVNRELGTTTAIITHNAPIAAIGDRVVTLGDGRIVAEERHAVKLPVASLRW